MIDKNSPIPLYFQLKEHLRRSIEDRTYVTGDILPSENELSDKYKISRMTVKQSLDSLASEGFVKRVKGRGTFVTDGHIEKNIHELTGLTGFSEDMVLRGMNPSSVIVRNCQIDAPLEISEILSESNVNFIKRIRFADNCPLGVEESYIPVSVIASISDDVLEDSIYNYLENVLGRKISYAKQTLEASIAYSDISKTLGIDIGAPTLILNRTSFLEDGTPFEFTKTTFRGDRYKYIVELNR